MPQPAHRRVSLDVYSSQEHDVSPAGDAGKPLQLRSWRGQEEAGTQSQSLSSGRHITHRHQRKNARAGRRARTEGQQLTLHRNMIQMRGGSLVTAAAE